MRCTYPGCDATPSTVGELFLAQSTANWRCDTHERAPEKLTRPISAIAREIDRVWPKPYFGAVPYLRAMSTLNTINDAFGADDARSIVLYFLSNSRNWRGEDARRLKTELKALLK